MRPILLGIIFLVFLIVLKRQSSPFEPAPIPKIIWTYWDSPDRPDMINKCIDSWSKHNPDFQIRILNQNSVRDWIPGDVKLQADSPQHTSDLIRIHLLAKHGGVWCDASILMTGPLDIITNSEHKFVGFYINQFTERPEWPVIENWFFACTPENPFVIKWRDTCDEIKRFERPIDFVEDMRRRGVDLQKISDPVYLSMHVAAQYVLQKLMTPEQIKEEIRVYPADTGPFAYLHNNNWDSVKGLESVCTSNSTDISKPFLKLRGAERKVIEENPRLNCVFGN